MRTLGVALASVALLARPSSAQSRASDRVDLLLYNGRIVTVDDRFSIASAVAIRGERIVAVGGDSLLVRLRADRTIDLRRHVVLPGFDDTHVHVGGVSQRNLDLSDATSIDQLTLRIRRRALMLGRGEWVTGSGWSEDDLAEQRSPSLAELDSTAPDNPVLLTRAGDHRAVANTAAMRLAGITRATPDPPDGLIEHDSTGALTGVFRDGASEPMRRLIPPPTPEERRESRIAMLRSLLTLGITSVVVASIAPEEYAEWEAIYRTMRDSLPRASIQIRPAIGADGDVRAAVESLRTFGRVTGDGDAHLRVGALEVYVDGGFTGPSAATLVPYRNQPTYSGTLLLTDDALHALATAAHAMRWQMAFHTVGDAAIAQAVHVLSRVVRESPRADHRHYLDHFSVLPPDSVLTAMVTARLAVAQQPAFTYTLERRYREYLDSARLATNNPLRSLTRRRIPLAFGSDNLPVSPLLGLATAVTRAGRSGTVYAPAEALTVREAITAYTRTGVWLTREERLKGTIQPGKLADLIVLSGDPLFAPPAEIAHMRVLMTILGGRVAYQREAIR